MEGGTLKLEISSDTERDVEYGLATRATGPLWRTVAMCKMLMYTRVITIDYHGLLTVSGTRLWPTFPFGAAPDDACANADLVYTAEPSGWFSSAGTGPPPNPLVLRVAPVPYCLRLSASGATTANVTAVTTWNVRGPAAVASAWVVFASAESLCHTALAHSHAVVPAVIALVLMGASAVTIGLCCCLYSLATYGEGLSPATSCDVGSWGFVTVALSDSLHYAPFLVASSLLGIGVGSRYSRSVQASVAAYRACVWLVKGLSGLALCRLVLQRVPVLGVGAMFVALRGAEWLRRRVMPVRAGAASFPWRPWGMLSVREYCDARDATTSAELTKLREYMTAHPNAWVHKVQYPARCQEFMRGHVDGAGDADVLEDDWMDLREDAW